MVIQWICFYTVGESTDDRWSANNCSTERLQQSNSYRLNTKTQPFDACIPSSLLLLHTLKTTTKFSPPRCWPSFSWRGCWNQAYQLLLCHIYLFSKYSCQTNYDKLISRSTGLLFARVARTVTLDDQSEISFLIPQGTLPWQPDFEVVGGICWMWVASGAAGWVTVGLCHCPTIIQSQNTSNSFTMNCCLWTVSPGHNASVNETTEHVLSCGNVPPTTTRN